MVLEENKIYTGKQLSEWFNIDPATFSRERNKYLDILKNFAEYECVGKRIKIIKVIENTYDKHWNSNYSKVRDKIPEVWNTNGLDSSKRVSEEIQHQLMLPITDNTVYAYTLRGRDELYGKPFGKAGSLGKCGYIWCKKIGDGWEAEILPLTPEEQQIKQDLITKYFGNVSEKQVLVKAMVESGEISKEEAWQVLEEMTNMEGRGSFFAFLTELQALLNCVVIRGTYIENQIEAKEEWIEWE